MPILFIDINRIRPYTEAFQLKRRTMKTLKPAVLFALAFLLTGTAPAIHAEDLPERYFVLKGGLYSPSEKYDINNFNGSTASQLEMRTGPTVEIALGQYSNPELALELGIGYFESKGAPADEPGSTKLKAVPIVITAKDFMLEGPFRPYFAGGVGVYITELEVSGNTGSFSTRPETTYGYHAGLGFNIDIANAMFIGVEGRYLWIKADYGGQPVKLNGYMSTINVGFSY